MFEKLKSIFRSPQPAGPQVELRAFNTSNATINQESVTIDNDTWRLNVTKAQTIRLFEIADPGIERCTLTYRARIKTENLQGKAYLEMWCRLPSHGEFFSKGLRNAVKGTNDWASYEIPFFLKQGQKPDLIKLNIVSEGSGTIWMKDIKLLQTPLK